MLRAKLGINRRPLALHGKLLYAAEGDTRAGPQFLNGEVADAAAIKKKVFGVEKRIRPLVGNGPVLNLISDRRRSLRTA